MKKIAVLMILGLLTACAGGGGHHAMYGEIKTGVEVTR